MHIMSKKDLSSDELYTLRRSRSPTVVLTAGGEVQTNEEAQVFVHDLILFVTVQILQETPAVLSLGKLCEDQRQMYAKRTTSYLLLFHGYPPVLEAIRRHEATNLPQKTGAGHCQKPQTKIKRGMTIEIRTTVCEIFLNSLEDFTDNGSACTRTRFSGPRFGTSHESGIKIKEAQFFFSQFPKDRNCDICLRTKITRAPCRRRTGEALP